MRNSPRPVLVIACGALAREIVALKKRHGWQHLHLTCLDARLHNRPATIPDRLRDTIRRHRDDYEDIFVAYGDCGTAGGIDQVLAEEGATRLDGAHCYEFFAGSERFAGLAINEPGTFYLTDFSPGTSSASSSKHSDSIGTRSWPARTSAITGSSSTCHRPRTTH